MFRISKGPPNDFSQAPQQNQVSILGPHWNYVEADGSVLLNQRKLRELTIFGWVWILFAAPLLFFAPWMLITSGFHNWPQFLLFLPIALLIAGSVPLILWSHQEWRFSHNSALWIWKFWIWKRTVHFSDGVLRLFPAEDELPAYLVIEASGKRKRICHLSYGNLSYDILLKLGKSLAEHTGWKLELLGETEAYSYRAHRG